jgi:site-specific recombinase XerC
MAPQARLSHLDSLPLREHIDDVWMSLRAANRRPKTLEDYQEVWRPFYVFLAQRLGRPPLLADFTLQGVQAYLAYERRPDRARPLADRSLVAKARTLKAIAGRLHADGKTATNRLAMLQTPAAAEADGRVLCDAERLALFLGAAGVSLTDRCTRALLAVLDDVGPRASELVSLDAADVDFVRGWILLREPAKRGLVRQLPLGRVSRQLLRNHLGRRHSGPLFIGHTGERLTDDAVRSRLVRLSQAVGIPRVSPHDFRRTAATLYTAYGASDDLRDRVFGWKPNRRARTSAAYVFLTPEHVVAAHRERLSPLDRLDPIRHRRDLAA